MRLMWPQHFPWPQSMHQRVISGGEYWTLRTMVDVRVTSMREGSETTPMPEFKKSKRRSLEWREHGMHLQTAETQPHTQRAGEMHMLAIYRGTSRRPRWLCAFRRMYHASAAPY